MFRQMIACFFVAGLLASMVQSRDIIPRGTTIDYTEQFWIESQHAVTDSFLIKIFLPPDYFKSDTSRFPLLVLTDGDAFWGAATDYTWFLHWQNPQLIVVGITYGGWTEGWGPQWKRRDDMTATPDSAGDVAAGRFLSFIRDELLPEIETKYRVDAGNRTLFGWSRGAEFAFYALFTQPELFQHYLVLGNIPAPGEPLDKLEKNYFAKRKDLPAKLYIGAGSNDTVCPHMNEYAEHLKQRNYTGLSLKSEILENFAHSYEAAVALMAKGLQYIFLKQDIFPEIMRVIEEQGADQVIERYKFLKRNAADEYDFSESSINNLGYSLIANKKYEAAIQILKLNTEEYPNSANAFDSLADACLAAGDKGQALIYVQKTLSILPHDAGASDAEKKQIKSWAEEKLKKIKGE